MSRSELSLSLSLSLLLLSLAARFCSISDMALVLSNLTVNR